MRHPPIPIICAAAPSDMTLLAQWETHLLPLQQARQIAVWSERHLIAGSPRTQQLYEHLDQAQIILFLLSAEFFASDECIMLMERALTGKARVIPLVVRPAAWKQSRFAYLACLPPNGLPVTSWDNPEEAFHVCYKELLRILEQERSATPPVTPKPANTPVPQNQNRAPILPFGRAKNYTIAIIGDTGSGKSHYIASCIAQLKKSYAWQFIGCMRVIGQGNTDKNYRDTYYTPLYIHREKIEATKPATTNIQEPLIYEMVFRKKSLLKPARTVNLLFYDSAGKDMREKDSIIRYCRYILNASAIIFLVDPQAVPGIANYLPDFLKRPPGSEDLEQPQDVLNRIIQTFEQAQRVKPGTTLHTPIAITISKSDLLRYVPGPKQKPFFLYDAARLDVRAFSTINREVRELLRWVGQRELLTSVSSFANKNFFAVSATGWALDDMNRFPNIEPLRCLDPLLWALWKLGLIDDV